ncbi:MAG: lipase family protein [Bacteriovoracaceae bacterium]|nr:lipase family protein [Bacteriovoracaceae bacterium]
MLLLQKETITTVDFDLSLSLLFARLSSLAYERFENDQAASLMTKLSELGFRYHSHFSVQNTQGFVAKNEKFAVIVFRGTEQDLYDILTDIKARLKDGGHEGFFGAFESVKSHIETAAQELYGTPIYVTGHSLGGAIAKVAIRQMAESFQACYTYGSPAICTKEKIEGFKVPVFRVVNCGDVVPRILSLSPLFIVMLQLGLWLWKQVLKLFKRDYTRVDSWLMGLNILSTDVVKYVHFGTLFCFDETGTFIPDASKEQSVFNQALSKNMKSAFEDHMIDKYISKLDALFARGR